MTTTPACVAFDLDDTLFLERDYVRSGFSAVGAWARANLGLADFAPRAWAAFEAGQRHTIFDDVLAGAGIGPAAELVATLVDVYRGHEPDIALLPDAETVLHRLRDRGVSLAVVTDGPLASQRRKARALDVASWASAVVFTAELGLPKPDPAAFARVERVFDREPTDCAYVADNPAKDFAGPNRRGWQTVRVRRAASLHVGVPSGPDVDCEIADLTELEDRLALAPR